MAAPQKHPVISDQANTRGQRSGARLDGHDKTVPTLLCPNIEWEEPVEDFHRAVLATRESRSCLLNFNVIQKPEATPVPMDGSASHGKLVFMLPRPSLRYNEVMSFLNTRSVKTAHENLWLAVGPGSSEP